MEFRKDIQILRGVAVLLVVIYHMYPDFLPSGYLGVDIFFVISGFLMAVFYKHGTQTAFAKSFYRRRFHRILPAYFFTLIISILVGSILFLPHEMSELYKEAIAAISLVPNIYLWSGESYFEGIVIRPLLHTWSLGLELQFYLIVPLIIWLFDKSRATYFLLLLGSIIACFYALTTSSKTAFFMLPFRLWEFLFGFSIAFYFANKGNRTVSFPVLGVVSLLVLMLLGFYRTDISEHPGIFALITCLLTSAILVCGLPTKLENSYVGRSLVLTGKYSYSLYLVHFPIIVFIFYVPFANEAKASGFDVRLVTSLVLMIIATYISYNWFETNKLTNATFNKNKLIFVLACLALAVVPTSYIINKLSTPTDIESISNSIADRSTWRCGKRGKLLRVLNPSSMACQINDVEEEGRGVLIIGDSHADAIKTTLARVAKEGNRQAFLMVKSCSFGDGECSLKNIFKLIEKHKITTIVLHDLYYNTNYKQVEQLLDLKPNEVEVVLVEPVPTYEVNIPAYLYNEKISSAGDKNLVKYLNTFQNDYQKYYSKMERLELKGLLRVKTVEAFCTPECEIISEQGKPYFFDNHHLTLTGAKLLEGALKEVIAQPN